MIAISVSPDLDLRRTTPPAALITFTSAISRIFVATFAPSSAETFGAFGRQQSLTVETQIRNSLYASYPCKPAVWRMAKATHAISADAGIVTNHAAMMLAPRPQRTADSFRLAPTPITAPVITCVVLTGSPASVAA